MTSSMRCPATDYRARPVDAVPGFLDELARRLVPECDAAVVQAVFSRASAGYTGPRGRDGLRVTAISPSGVPFEASVTGGPGRSSAALRYVTETATGMPFFGPRMAAQRAALDDLIAWLPAAALDAACELRAAVDVLFPDPGAVPARRRFATTFGIVHRPEVPDGIAGLKLYGNLRTGEPEAAAATAADALTRLAGRWTAFARLGDAVGDLTFLEPHFATIEVDAAGRLGHKLYLRTRRANAAGLALAARRVGADLAPVADALRRAGVDDELWRRRFFVCAAVDGGPAGGGAVGDVPVGRPAVGGAAVRGEPAGGAAVGGCGGGDMDGASVGGDADGDEVELSVHLSTKALRLARAGMAHLARTLVSRHGDVAGIDALDGAMACAGGTDRWPVTVVGLGLAPGEGVGKVNVYTSTDGEAIVRG